MSTSTEHVTAAADTPASGGTLAAAFAEYRKQNPDTRIRNAAADLGASEAELVATSVDGEAVALRPDIPSILGDLEALGPVMALTRNDACVHEKNGVYANVRIDPHASAVINEEIDLRMFLDRWRFAFAVRTAWDGAPDGWRRSLQFFDANGDAVHKVFLTRKSDVAVFEALVSKYAVPSEEQEMPAVAKRAAAAPAPTEPPAGFDAEAFLSGWGALKDTHDFFPLLRQHRLTRIAAMRVAEGRFARRVGNDGARRTLDAVSGGAVPIMVFVGNPGCIQIHTGPVYTVKEHGPWYNVLDPGFNLHLNETLIAESWVVEKPTEDGPVTALELYAADGSTIAQIFGARKPGKQEDPKWRGVVEALR